MRGYQVYLHPRTFKRKFTLFYQRFIKGRSKNPPVPILERQVLKQFYTLVQEPDIKMFHYVNGVFAKEAILYAEDGMTCVRLVDNETKIFFYKKDKLNNIVIETYVCPRTAALMNRLFDKEFEKMLVKKKEAENKRIKEVFKNP